MGKDCLFLQRAHSRRYQAERLADCWTRARPFMWPVELPSASSRVKLITTAHMSSCITLFVCQCVCEVWINERGRWLSIPGVPAVMSLQLVSGVFAI